MSPYLAGWLALGVVVSLIAWGLVERWRADRLERARVERDPALRSALRGFARGLREAAEDWRAER